MWRAIHSPNQCSKRRRNAIVAAGQSTDFKRVNFDRFELKFGTVEFGCEESFEVRLLSLETLLLQVDRGLGDFIKSGYRFRICLVAAFLKNELSELRRDIDIGLF